MKRETIKSSNIKEMAFNEKEAELEIVFSSGGTYIYSGVTLEDISELKEAPSFGKKFHELKLARKWNFRKL